MYGNVCVARTRLDKGYAVTVKGQYVQRCSCVITRFKCVVFLFVKKKLVWSPIQGTFIVNYFYSTLHYLRIDNMVELELFPSNVDASLSASAVKLLHPCFISCIC